MSADYNGFNDDREEEREALFGLPCDDDSWRGTEHPDGEEEEWPESECSAEYWIYKRIRDEEGEV